jgi:hypothetical protein
MLSTGDMHPANLAVEAGEASQVALHSSQKRYEDLPEVERLNKRSI